jgi:hypothetical protein
MKYLWEEIKEVWLGLLVAFILVSLLIFAVHHAIQGEKELQKEHIRHLKLCKFKQWEMVKTKIDGRVGQIIEVNLTLAGHLYDVRFPNSLEISTNTHLLDKDDPITVGSPYTTCTLHEAELEKYVK